MLNETHIKIFKEVQMSFELPALPYALDALAPAMSKETLEFHYGKHHKAYVDKLNAAAEGTEFARLSLEEVIIRSREEKKTGIFNNAAQIWNHTFFWNGLKPGGSKPSAELEKKLSQSFGSVEDFKKKFSDTAAATFGSGWAWLVKKSDGTLEITSTSNAENPLGGDSKALLTCDVWEHAYYIDYRNARPKFLEAFWSIVNWDFIDQNL